MRKNIFTVLAVGLFFSGLAQSNPGESINLFQSTYNEPQSVIMKNQGHYFFDFGKAAFGTLSLTFKSSQSRPLIIHLGEKISDSGVIDKNPGGTIRYQKVILSDFSENSEILVKLNPDKRNTKPKAIALPDSFGVIMPFRYCEIENLEIPINEVVVRQKAYHYRFNDSSSEFVSSDTILNHIWELCKYTIKATSFCGIYIDGDRERIPYEADAYINQLSHYAVDNEYEMAKETIKYFFANPTWPTEWLLHTVFMIYQDYYYTGDIELLNEYYEPLKAKTLYELGGEEGFISSFSHKVTGKYMQKLGFADTTKRIRDIVDWPPAQKDTGWNLATEEGERDGHEMMPINTVVNCFFYENMRMMAELAKVLKKEDDAVLFKRVAMKVKGSINEKLLDKEKGVYIDGIGSDHSSIHSNMLPLAFQLVPEKHLGSVVEFVKSRKMACSVYGAQYLLEGLYQAGEDDYALDLIVSRDDRSWWNMIRSGSTLTMEAWDMKYKPNSDWNHAWGAAPANIISRYMWGITPSQPGFDSVKIKPQLSNLTFSKITVPTIKGTIKAEYKKVNNKEKLYILELPEDMEGEFILTHDDNSKIFLNNTIQARPSVLQLNPGINRIEILDNF